MNCRIAIYVAGPLGTGFAVAANVARAIDAGEQLRRAGFAPFVPHVTGAWANRHPAVTYEEWMAWDFAWLERCDALVRLPGTSPGADREVARALELGLPVFDRVEDAIATLAAWERGREPRVAGRRA